MKTIYIKPYSFKCSVTNDGTMTAVETDAFDGKCDAFIEGYRYVPPGKSWRRYDGAVFHGEMIAPWKDYAELAAAQAQYDRDNAELQAAYQEGVNSAYD